MPLGPSALVLGCARLEWAWSVPNVGHCKYQEDPPTTHNLRAEARLECVSPSQSASLMLACTQLLLLHSTHLSPPRPAQYCCIPVPSPSRTASSDSSRRLCVHCQTARVPDAPAIVDGFPLRRRLASTPHSHDAWYNRTQASANAVRYRHRNAQGLITFHTHPGSSKSSYSRRRSPWFALIDGVFLLGPRPTCATRSRLAGVTAAPVIAVSPTKVLKDQLPLLHLTRVALHYSPTTFRVGYLGKPNPCLLGSGSCAAVIQDWRPHSPGSFGVPQLKVVIQRLDPL